jgi:hypothetical protein
MSALALSELSSAGLCQFVYVLEQARFDAIPVRNSRTAQTKSVPLALGFSSGRKRAQHSHE